MFHRTAGSGIGRPLIAYHYLDYNINPCQSGPFAALLKLTWPTSPTWGLWPHARHTPLKLIKEHMHLYAHTHRTPTSPCENLHLLHRLLVHLQLLSMFQTTPTNKHQFLSLAAIMSHNNVVDY